MQVILYLVPTVFQAALDGEDGRWIQILYFPELVW